MFIVQQYDVVKATKMMELLSEVNDMLKHGWQPFGGVSIAYQGDGQQVAFAQAMVKGVEQI